MVVQNFRGPSRRNFRGQKHAKFDPISDDFKVWGRISPERMKIFKIGEVLFSTALPPALGEKSWVNFGPVILEI